MLSVVTTHFYGGLHGEFIEVLYPEVQNTLPDLGLTLKVLETERDVLDGCRV